MLSVHVGNLYLHPCVCPEMQNYAHLMLLGFIDTLFLCLRKESCVVFSILDFQRQMEGWSLASPGRDSILATVPRSHYQCEVLVAVPTMCPTETILGFSVLSQNCRTPCHSCTLAFLYLLTRPVTILSTEENKNKYTAPAHKDKRAEA